MRVKQDTIPGESIPVWFTPTMTGDWEINCSQLCGLGHYRMRGFYSIKTQAEYDAWLKETAAVGAGAVEELESRKLESRKSKVESQSTRKLAGAEWCRPFLFDDSESKPSMPKSPAKSVRLIVERRAVGAGANDGREAAWLRRHGDAAAPHVDARAARACGHARRPAHRAGLAGRPLRAAVDACRRVSARVRRRRSSRRSTIALEHELIVRAVDGRDARDRYAGRAVPRRPRAVDAATAGRASTCVGVSLIGRPSRPLGGLPVRVGTRAVNVDIAFGGEFYAIADSEADRHSRSTCRTRPRSIRRLEIKQRSSRSRTSHPSRR